jgi:hypothetical protein
MALVIAEAEVEVTVDGSKLPDKVGKDIEANSDGPMSRAGLGLAGKLFAGFVAFKGVQAAGDWIGGAITGGSDLNETINKSTSIFGDGAAAMERWADTAATTVGMSKAAALGAAASFGDMFLQLGFTGSAASDMSKSVVQAAADLGSFSNLETADVSERISAAFRGEYDSLQAVIPNINAARVESEALAATGKTLTSELTAQDKAAAVLAIVHKDGARAMGDFARTSDDYANSTKIAQAQLSDLQGEVGTALLPTMTDLMMLVRDNIIPAFSGAAQWFGENIGLIKGIALAVGVAAGAFVLLNAGMSIYNGIMKAQAIVTGAATIQQGLLNLAMKANPIGIIITLIALLVGAIVWVATQTTFFQDAWAVMTEVIGNAWNWLWGNVLEPVFTAIGAVFTWLYENIIMPIVTGIMIYIGLWAAVIVWLWETVLSPVFAAIGAVFTWLWENAIMPIVGYIQLAIQGWGLIFQWLYGTIIAPVFAAIGTAFNWVWSNVISPVVGFISGAITNVGNTVRSVFGGIGDFIGSAFQAALSVVRGPINGIIGLVNQAIRGINSLSVTIPDWVPIVGGQTWGLDIPRIPMLARGSAHAPGAFIAGEQGPELIVGAEGSRVYPNNETERMLGKGDSEGALIAGDLIINEADDPLGSAGRVAKALRKYRKR